MTGLLETLTGLTLLEPAWLLLALLVPPALWARRRRAPRGALFAPASLLHAGGEADGRAPGIPATVRTRLASVPTVLHVVCLLLAVVALARPVRRDPVPPETEGIDIVLCLDVSSSMSADDMDARRTRLEVAKDAAAEFVAGRPHDRIGLVSFARFPDLRCPPTLDHEALLAILGEVATVEGDGPEDATGIGTAVARAAQVLRTSPSESRVVVLLTDGAENVATAARPGEIAPLHAGQLCETLRVRVHTIAASGSAGSAAASAETRQVERMSARTGGRFFVARDADAVASVYADIDALERTRFEEPRFRFEERFAPFALASLALFVAGVLTAATWFEVIP